MIVLKILLAEMVHVRGTEDHKPIRTFLTDGLHKPLDIGVCVRRSVGIANRFYVVLLKHLLESLRELRVTVMLYQTNRQVQILGLLDERFGLRNHPTFIGMVRGWRNALCPSRKSVRT